MCNNDVITFEQQALTASLISVIPKRSCFHLCFSFSLHPTTLQLSVLCPSVEHAGLGLGLGPLSPEHFFLSHLVDLYTGAHCIVHLVSSL